MSGNMVHSEQTKCKRKRNLCQPEEQQWCCCVTEHNGHCVVHCVVLSSNVFVAHKEKFVHVWKTSKGTPWCAQMVGGLLSSWIASKIHLNWKNLPQNEVGPSFHKHLHSQWLENAQNTIFHSAQPLWTNFSAGATHTEVQFPTEFKQWWAWPCRLRQHCSLFLWFKHDTDCGFDSHGQCTLFTKKTWTWELWEHGLIVSCLCEMCKECCTKMQFHETIKDCGWGVGATLTEIQFPTKIEQHLGWFCSLSLQHWLFDFDLFWWEQLLSKPFVARIFVLPLCTLWFVWAVSLSEFWSSFWWCNNRNCIGNSHSHGEKWALWNCIDPFNWPVFPMQQQWHCFHTFIWRFSLFQIQMSCHQFSFVFNCGQLNLKPTMMWQVVSIQDWHSATTFCSLWPVESWIWAGSQ